MYNKRVFINQFLIFISSIILSCSASSTLKTFVEPSFDSNSVKSVAIFPIRNVRIIPSESREMNRNLVRKFNNKNPDIKIVGPVESVTLLNEADLTDIYNNFLVIYAQSGIPNINYLNEIGKSLQVDAILQGEVFDISQNDGGGLGRNLGKTSVTIRYYLISTNNGAVIWEAMSQGDKKTKTVFGSAPPLYEAIEISQERILSALPTLGGK